MADGLARLGNPDAEVLVRQMLETGPYRPNPAAVLVRLRRHLEARGGVLVLDADGREVAP